MSGRDLVARLFADVVNDGAPERVHDLLAADFAIVSANYPDGERVGPDGFGRIVAVNRAAFPDWTAVIEGQVAEDDWIVSRWTSTATHRGAFQGVSATGRRVTVRGCYWHRITGGRIAEQRTYADMAGLIRQLKEP